jgi:signal transduction histidine kinase
MASDRTAVSEYLGNVSRGAHLCEFHSTCEELTETLVPYFTAGVQHDEFCVWVTSDPAGVKGAQTRLRKAAPHLDRYLGSGQFEILDCRDWYLRGGHFDADRVLGQWAEKERHCLNSGFNGLRVSGEMAWLEKRDWLEFMAYEAEVDRVLPQHHVTGLCSYPLDACTADEVLEVVRNHHFALGLPVETTEAEQSRFPALVLEQHDEDRRWIAGQLHEVTAQNVVAIRLFLENLQQQGKWSSEIKSLISNCHLLCEQSLTQILRLSNLLHPPILDGLGLAACLRQHISEFTDRNGIQVDFETPSDIGRLPQEMETHLFRVAQEGLCNIAQHSGSLEAIVRLERRGDQVILQIEDFGCGLSAASAGVGIPAMQERLQKLGGRLEMRSTNRGTTLTATAPIAFTTCTEEN